MHGRCNLLNYIFDCVAISHTTAVVNVTADKKYFGNQRLKIAPASVFINRVELGLGQMTDDDCPGFLLPCLI